MNAAALTYSTVARRTYVPYSSYGKSGLEWLPKIPATWKTTRNAFLFRQRDERNFPDLPLLEVSINSGVTLRNFSDDHIEQQAEDPSTYKRARRGDLVFNKMRMWQGAVGVATTDGLVSPDYIVAVPFYEVDARYFEHLFRTTYYLTEINKYSHRIVKDRNRLYWDDFKQIVSVQPPLHEQLSIVRFIGRMTAKIDALIAKKQRLIELLQEKRSALISHAVTKGLDPEVPMKESGIDSLDQIPQDWELVSVRRFATAVEQGWSPVAEDRQAEDEEWAVIKLSAIHKGHFRSWEHKALPKDLIPERRYEIKDGDFLITRSNTPDLVGDVCVVDSARSRLMLCDLVYRVQVDEERIDKRFLSYSMLSRFGRHQITAEARGSSQSMVKIAQSHVRSLTIVAPRKQEQQTIVRFLDESTGKIDRLALIVGDGIEKLREYRTALISAAVTGKIDVRGEAE